MFADPKTDFVFKRIFGAEDQKPLLVALLNDLLELEGPSRIRDVEHLSLEQHIGPVKRPESSVSVKSLQLALDSPRQPRADDAWSSAHATSRAIT